MHVEHEIEEMHAEAKESAAAGSFTLSQLFSSPDLRLPLIIAILLQVAQQWSGINAVRCSDIYIYIYIYTYIYIY